MYTIIILDSYTGVANIHTIDSYAEDDQDTIVEELGYEPSVCTWIISLELEDKR